MKVYELMEKLAKLPAGDTVKLGLDIIETGSQCLGSLDKIDATSFEGVIYLEGQES